jgi:hypothetical protein
VVLIPGTTGTVPVLSDRKFTPTPQAVETTISYVFTSLMTGSKYSGSQWRIAPRWFTSIVFPSCEAFIRRSEAMVSASFSPPAWQMATQVLHPNTRTFFWSFTMFQISSIGFCDPTIIGQCSFMWYASGTGTGRYVVLIPSFFTFSENSSHTAL